MWCTYKLLIYIVDGHVKSRGNCYATIVISRRFLSHTNRVFNTRIHVAIVNI